MANGLALDRCDQWGHDPAHENCWKVFNFRETDASGKHPEMATHVSYGEAMALVVDIPLEEIERLSAELERQTPEEEQAWWDALSK